MGMIGVARSIAIREDEARESFLRASGPGGQDARTFRPIPERLNPSFHAAPALPR
jgi:hypothetical protein